MRVAITFRVQGRVSVCARERMDRTCECVLCVCVCHILCVFNMCVRVRVFRMCAYVLLARAPRARVRVCVRVRMTRL